VGVLMNSARPCCKSWSSSHDLAADLQINVGRIMCVSSSFPYCKLSAWHASFEVLVPSFVSYSWASVVGSAKRNLYCGTILCDMVLFFVWSMPYLI
jgi:hypothetical protein